MRSFFDENWTVTFVCLTSRHQSRISSSTEKQVLGLGIMAQSIPSVPIPPGICWAFHFNSIQFYLHFYKIFTLYILRQEYTNKGGEEEGKKKINGLDRSVRWSEELGFRANHFVILFWKLSCKCSMVGPGVHTKIPRWGLKIGCKCPTPGQHQNCIFQ